MCLHGNVLLAESVSSAIATTAWFLRDVIPEEAQQAIESAPAPLSAPEPPAVGYAAADQKPAPWSQRVQPRGAPQT